jgi:hypothetical protein
MQMRISTTQVFSVMLRLKKLEILNKKKIEKRKSRRMKTKQSVMKLSQIGRRIELCLKEIVLRFGMNLQNLLFLDSSIHICILKQVPKYLANGL